MVTPELRRRVVKHLQGRFGVSERRACKLVGQARSTQRKLPAPPQALQQRLREWLRAFSARHPRWGWRRATTLARKAGFVVNRKRVQRLWRDEGLKVPYRRKKKVPLGIGVQVGAFCPLAANVVWAIDFQFDQTEDAKTLKLLNIIDEFTRECLAIEVARSITSDQLVAVLERLAAERGAPAYLRMDNGPELIAFALADWCRFSRTDSVFIDPGSPWQNPWVESFNGRLRDEFLNGCQFGSLLEAKVLLEDWRIEYNCERPHSALGMLSPAEFAQAWTSKQSQLQLA
jgi:putative transposase